MIVNGFDRISAAATLETDAYLGFADFWDEGVPDKLDLNYIGRQYDFLASSPWIDDDAPGHGSSYGDYETTILPGNTFDFPFLHGKAIRAAGYSFVSCSDEAVMDQSIQLADYEIVDIILGEEKEIPGPKASSRREFRAFPKAFQREITAFTQKGGALFISGAYVGMDLFDNNNDSLDVQFAEEILKFSFRTDHAVKTGGVASVDSAFFISSPSFEFNTDFNSTSYKVESPDAIEPMGIDAKTILRYSENNTSAAIAAKGGSNIIIFGFPFESIMAQKSRDKIMESVLAYLSDSD